MAERLTGRAEGRRGGCVSLIIAAIVILICSRWIASTLIDYLWWSEMRQVDTWISLLLYGTGPILVALVLFFLAFWISFRAGLRKMGHTALFGFIRRRYVRFAGLAIAILLAILVANATVDSWTVVRYFGGLRLPPGPGEYVDPIFREPLHFYFFSLPFYNLLLRVVLTGAVLSLLIYWLTSHAEKLSKHLPTAYPPEPGYRFEGFNIREAFDASFVRLVIAILLIGIAIKIYFDRYALLMVDHGQYLVGVDWVADHIVLPLQWAEIICAVAGATLLLVRRGRLAVLLLLILPVRFFLPSIIAGLYVRPNELALEKPYIQHHIEATRSAYGLNQRVREGTLEAAPEIPVDYARHKPLLDNVRLWDWRAFHDTISQIQPLRPYVYVDTDIDRYTIDGRLRQVLISPRELDIRQLGEAANRWINPHLIYTHGYGVVMAEANRITPDGLPVLFVKDAPAIVTSKTLKLTEPELYYSEQSHEPVYVDTAQQEFNYPSGSESVYTRYKGTGGFSISSPLTRLAAAVHYGDVNVLLTEYLNSNSRMMIHRQILERVSTLVGFVTWDHDPYIVMTNSGRLMWIADGYMSSYAHPYSRELEVANVQTVNYIRNSVKATIDAYTGEVNLYVFAPGDVLIQAYERLFPNLFKPADAMPEDLRAHVRYPEMLFDAQAEIYRTFHMRDPEAFYNRADLWDLAKTSGGPGEAASAVAPTYVVATLPDSNVPEFLLLTTFTPANKDNLIGVMYARCDGPHLGELVFEQLSKQNIIFGPMQIDARINQDQTISKDLTLWNQQGSQVLRGQTLVLPVDNSFLYIEPIYIQASQARMPQLKKVALAMGNVLAYADTYEQALGQLIQEVGGNGAGLQAANAPAPVSAQNAPPTTPAPTQAPAVQTSAQAVRTLQQIRDHLAQYRELSAQGKWADAGKELDEIQKLVQK
ncbi:MAG: UPF0182 family protein [Acidobacteriaceae bacterium]|nr:UPF0182 family protein [Acidobacteriaceae bacterium]MBV9499412.1 UPF0182 family protein [Acidobacteriaceae bacterium]